MAFPWCTNTSGMDEAGCVNAMSEEECLHLVSQCNGANVCADRRRAQAIGMAVVRLFSDDYPFISTACDGGMVALTLIVAFHSQFACYGLERNVGSGSACHTCHA